MLEFGQVPAECWGEQRGQFCTTMAMSPACTRLHAPRQQVRHHLQSRGTGIFFACSPEAADCSVLVLFPSHTRLVTSAGCTTHKKGHIKGHQRARRAPCSRVVARLPVNHTVNLFSKASRCLARHKGAGGCVQYLCKPKRFCTRPRRCHLPRALTEAADSAQRAPKASQHAINTSLHPFAGKS